MRIKMYYIYEYVDPRNLIPFYIGKGKGQRMLAHLHETEETTNNVRKFRKIRKIRSEGMEPIINIIVDDITDEDMAYDIEEAYIQKYGRIDFEPNGVLTNICLGSRPPVSRGDRNGMFNKKHTDESKAKMREALKGRVPWNVGIPRDESVKDAVRRANKGKTPWNKGKERNEEDKQKMKEGWAKKKAEGFVSPAIGRVMPKNTQCEHCGQFVTKGHHTRWHGPNCKNVNP